MGHGRQKTSDSSTRGLSGTGLWYYYDVDLLRVLAHRLGACVCKVMLAAAVEATAIVPRSIEAWRTVCHCVEGIQVILSSMRMELRPVTKRRGRDARSARRVSSMMIYSQFDEDGPSCRIGQSGKDQDKRQPTRDWQRDRVKSISQGHVSRKDVGGDKVQHSQRDTGMVEGTVSCRAAASSSARVTARTNSAEEAGHKGAPG